MANVQEIELLVEKRATIKARMASFRSFIKEYQDGKLVNASKIRTRLEKFRESVTNMDNVCDELDQLDVEMDQDSEKILMKNQALDLMSEAAASIDGSIGSPIDGIKLERSFEAVLRVTELMHRLQN